MNLSSLRSLWKRLRDLPGSGRRRPAAARRRPQLQPRLEALEDRCVPTTNAVSQFPITVDGQFSGGGEWSDVTPLTFHSPTTPGGQLQATNGPTDPLTNSELYASLAVPPPGESGAVDDGIYLMYDYLPRTNPTFAPGEFIADITFPVTLPGQTQEQVITVQFRGAQGGAAGNPSFDVFVDVDQDGRPDFAASQLGMVGAVGFGSSPLSATPHLLVELEVPLRIPAGFASPNSPLPGNGINPATGLYDPSPQFWGGGFAGNPGSNGTPGGGPADPPGTSALFRINPDGSVTATPNIVDHIATLQSTKPVNLTSNGLVTVTILSSAGFDATKINLSTLIVNGKSASSLGVRVVVGDVNGDGRADVTLEFHAGDLTAAGVLSETMTSLVFTGTMADGTTFGGSVLLSVVPKKKK